MHPVRTLRAYSWYGVYRIDWFEDIRERGHPARFSRRNCTHAAGRMLALRLGARQSTCMSGCPENVCAEGALDCGSASYRRSLEFQGGSSAVALQGVASRAQNAN